MTSRFKVLDFSSPEVNRARLAFHLTKLATVWTRLFGPNSASLLLQEFLDGSLRHRTGCMHRDLFDVVGVEIEIGSYLVFDPPRHNLSPPLRHITDPR